MANILRGRKEMIMIANDINNIDRLHINQLLRQDLFII